ncbi:MAG: hypothetical protein AAGA96_15865 [Verrucomicrobiota bacterium]
MRRQRSIVESALTFTVIAICGISTLRSEERIEVAAVDWRSVEAVDQRDFAESANACAPAAVLNLLKLSRLEFREAHDSLLGGTDSVRLQFFVDRYFKGRRSSIEPSHRRWGVHGVFAEDLVLGLNEFLSDQELTELNSQYLNRVEGENTAELIQRCHRWVSGSLKNGVTPVLSMRVFVVRVRDGETEPTWHPGPHHNVVVVSTDREVSELGFSLKAIDPWGGRPVELTLHREPYGQGFQALMGSGEKSRWLAGEPFLQVVAPKVLSLRPASLVWSERVVVTAHFLIGDY